MTPSPEPEAAARQYLSFQVGDQTCGIGLASVREIVRYESVTRVPRAAAWVRGVVNLRGVVVPVVDLAVALGMPPTSATAQSCLLVVEVAGARSVIALLVDEVRRVLDLQPEDVDPPVAFGARVSSAFLEGMARGDDGFTLLLDLERLFSEGGLLRNGSTTDTPASVSGPDGGAA